MFGNKTVGKKTKGSKGSSFKVLVSKYKLPMIIIVIAVVAVGGYFGYAAYQDMNAGAAGLTDCKNSTLKSGSKGNCVKELQKSLNDKYCSGLAVDGSFGPATKSAVTSYQSSKGLVVDGIAGKNTISSLISAPSSPCRGHTGSSSGAGAAASKGWTDGSTLKVLDSKKGTSATLVASACKQEVSGGKYKVKARVKVTASTITTAGKIYAQVYPAKGAEISGNTITAVTGNISTSGWSPGDVLSTNMISVWIKVGSSGYTLDTSAEASLGRALFTTSKIATCA